MVNFMSKRNKLIIKTPECLALKALRMKAGLSLRKLADLMDISFVRVHQWESGRDEVTNEYVKKFLVATGQNQRDWESELKRCRESKNTYSNNDISTRDYKYKQDDDIRYKTKLECLRIISKLNHQRLEVALELLKNIV